MLFLYNLKFDFFMNNFIKKFHQILGIIITFPLILMALTGIILVFFEFQNGWKVNKVLDAEEIIMQFEKAHEGKKVERISLAGKVKIRASQEGKRYNYIFTEGRFAPFQSNLRNFAILIHDARFIPNGRQFVGILGILKN